MTELIVPEVAYQPIATMSQRPNAWMWHLSKYEDERGVRTVCGLTLTQTVTALIGDVPPGRMCKQCLGALKEKGE